MDDPVAIVSVVGSTLVGLGGLASTTWGQHATRVWQGREERASEMRAVLDAAATQIATAMQSAADAHQKLSRLDPERTPQPVGQAGLDKAAEQLASAIGAERQIWVASNRLRVRTGAEAHVALALKKAEHEVGLLVAIVEREKRDLVTSEDNYTAAWASAEAAERAFYDAAAKDLNATVGGGWRHRR